MNALSRIHLVTRDASAEQMLRAGGIAAEGHLPVVFVGSTFEAAHARDLGLHPSLVIPTTPGLPEWLIARRLRRVVRTACCVCWDTPATRLAGLARLTTEAAPDYDAVPRPPNGACEAVRAEASGMPLVALAALEPADCNAHPAVVGAALALLADSGELALVLPYGHPALARATEYLGTNPLGLRLIAADRHPLAIAAHADLVIAMPNERSAGAPERVAHASKLLLGWGVDVRAHHGTDPTDASLLDGRNATGATPIIRELLSSAR
ncbi:MAG: hypothetical protein AAGB51_04190 [Planctomycetota bacterium]